MACCGELTGQHCGAHHQGPRSDERDRQALAARSDKPARQALRLIAEQVNDESRREHKPGNAQRDQSDHHASFLSYIRVQVPIVCVVSGQPSVTRFLAASRTHALYPAFVLLLYGLRRGEVLGLSWPDVDFDQGVIHICQQLIRAGHQLQLGPDKTAAGRRKLPLLGIARDVLLAEQAEIASKPSGSSWTRHELVFTTRTGGAIEPRNLARSFERICRQATPRPIRSHDLRHRTTTLLNQLGVPLRTALPAPGTHRLTWVGLRGLEPRTSSLSGKRSNRLSYRPLNATLTRWRTRDARPGSLGAPG